MSRSNKINSSTASIPGRLGSRVLNALAQENPQSVYTLAHHLHEPAETVTLVLSRLQELGVDLSCDKSAGVQLNERITPLETQRIEEIASESGEIFPNRLHIFDEIDSTNRFLQTLSETADVHGHVCLAEYQNTGRGRMQRTWVAPAFRTLMFSIAWDFERSAQTMSGLSLAVGVALIEVLQRYSLSSLGLKWPNDLYCQGRELGGILIELVNLADNGCRAIIGMGVNVYRHPSTGDFTSIDMIQAGAKAIDRSVLAGEFIGSLYKTLAEFQQYGFSSFTQRWNDMDYFRHCPVQIDSADGSVEGISMGVNETGALLIETKENMIVPIYAGSANFSMDVKSEDS